MELSIELITTRTLDDVIYQEDLRQAIINRTATVEQWREWLKEMRGRNDVYTLNRVGRAMIEIAALVTELYAPVSVSPKINWMVSDIPTPAQMQHYLDDIEKIRLAVASVLVSLPPTPTSMNNFTYQLANNVEEILLQAKLFVEQIRNIFAQSGIYQSGSVYFFKKIDPQIEASRIFIQSGMIQSGSFGFFPIMN